MTTRKTHAEHSQLVDTSHWFDAILDRVPSRVGELATPPAGSNLTPVRGDRGLPFVGLGIHIIRYGPAFQIQILRRHGPVSWCRAFGRKIVTVSGTDAVQAVLTNKDKAFVSGWPDVIGPWFDGSLLAMDSTEHLADRRLMQAAYSKDAIEGYLRRMTEDVNAALAQWPAGKRFKAFPAIRKLSGQITTRAFLGVPYAAAGWRVIRAVEACVRAETALLRLKIPGTAWHRAHRARRWLTEYLTRAVPAARVREDDDFLSVISRIEGSNLGRFTTQQIVNHMIFTVLASHDTTTVATVAAIYFLGKHPEWQSRARAESITHPRHATGHRWLESTRNT